MKLLYLKTIAVFTSLLPQISFSQDTAKIRQIDSLVSLINNSNFEIERDTIKQDLPDAGISMRTYLTVVTNDSELKKYVNNVRGTTQKNGVNTQITSTNIFYFDHNKLIKVEESAKEGEKKEFEALWYYSDDRPIYYTLKSDKAEDRAQLLLTLAKAMLEKIKR